MKRIFNVLFLSFLVFFIGNTFAKPGFIVVPFAQSISVAPNSKTTVLVVAQNNTSANQTITNIVPIIPPKSGVIASVRSTNCGFLKPGGSCEILINLQTGNRTSLADLNVSVCSFNGAFCSRFVKSLYLKNSQLTDLFIAPHNKTIASFTTQQFYAVGLFSNGTIQNVSDSVSWSSSNPASAKISNASDSKGLAIGVAAGISGISARLGALSRSTKLAVTDAVLTSISINPINPSIAKNTNKQFTATGLFNDGSNQDITSQVTWSSSNTTIATIASKNDQAGLAMGKNVGTTTISVAFNGMTDSTTLTVTAATLKSISVTPANPEYIVYSTQQFTATGIYSDDSVQDLTKSVTWKSQSALVAIISNQSDTKGLAFDTGVGTTQITAALGAISGSTNLKVTNAKLTKIDVVPIIATIPSGTNRQYQAIGTYSNNKTRDITTKVTWQSSNNSIASISNAPGSQGLATGTQTGKAVISATLDGIVGRADLTVNNPTLVSITVTPNGTSIPNGTDQQFMAMGNYSDGSQQDLTREVTWTSTVTSIANISNAEGTKGLAQGLSVGDTTIAATYNNISGNTLLTVTGATLVSLVVTPANVSISIGEKTQYTATGNYSDGSSKNLTRLSTWSSSSTATATISNVILTKGRATGLAVGTTTIQAVYKGVSSNATLNVIKQPDQHNCSVTRREDSSSYWLGYDVYTNSAPFTLDFSATGINLTEIIVSNGVFSNVQVLDKDHLYIGIKPDWVSTANPGFIDFYGPNYGPYEPFNTTVTASCQTSTLK